jgi:hypothetical protein
MSRPLPPHFCWTRFGTEAGESVAQILARKERERQGNNGVFLWGIGNALGPSMRELLKLESTPDVAFSPMLTRPRQSDVSPPAVLTWQSARDLDGSPVQLPRSSTVTSRASLGGRTARHYALVCYSEAPLVIDHDPPLFSIGSLENLLTKRPVGASQVTAVVRHAGDARPKGAMYRLAFRARLIAPFYVELGEPQLSSSHARHRAAGASPESAVLGGAPSP